LFKPRIEEVLGTLSKEEFAISGKLFNGFAGQMTKQGFDKLINNSAVKKINLDVMVSISSQEIDIDPKISRSFGNQTWVRIIINLRDGSETDNFIAIFSGTEFKLINKSSNQISAEITEKGFFTVIQDGRVGKVYLDVLSEVIKEDEKERKTEIREGSLRVYIIIGLVVFVIFLYLVIKKKK